MNAISATVPANRMRTRPSRARRPQAWVGLLLAIVAGALMLIAAFMSASGLQNQAWEKQSTATPTEQAAPAAPADSAYVTEPSVATQP